eukprot:COSAG05_NODE_20272_length_281_cov_0.532967_1_plen_86_part_01
MGSRRTTGNGRRRSNQFPRVSSGWKLNSGSILLVVVLYFLLYFTYFSKYFIQVKSSLLKKYFFFFKQKTAYEMESRDWSSDVCSSD